MPVSKEKKVRHKWRIEHYDRGMHDILHCQTKESDLRISVSGDMGIEIYISTAHDLEYDIEYNGKCPNCGVRVPKRILFQAKLLSS